MVYLNQQKWDVMGLSNHTSEILNHGGNILIYTNTLGWKRVNQLEYGDILQDGAPQL